MYQPAMMIFLVMLCGGESFDSVFIKLSSTCFVLGTFVWILRWLGHHIDENLVAINVPFLKDEGRYLIALSVVCVCSLD